MKQRLFAVILAAVTAVFALPSEAPAGDAAPGATTLAATSSALPPLVRTRQEHPQYSLGPVNPERREMVRKINADCLSCHSVEGVRTPPRSDMDLGKLATLTISETGLAKSVHSGQACTNCHGDAASHFPHPQTVKQDVKACVDCHPRSAKYVLSAFQDSRHFLRHKSDFTCGNCHDPHGMVLASKLTSPAQVARQDNAPCLGCHQDEGKFASLAPTRKMPDLALHHAWLPNVQMHWASVRCIDCHAETTEAGYSHQFVRIVKANRDCSSCHSTESSLRNRLYRKALTEPPINAAGFINPYILSQAYVVGATRDVWIDQIILGLGALLLASLLLHGAIRLMAPARAKIGAKEHRIYIFGRWIRIWHWVNAALMVALAVSGLSLHFSRSSAALLRFGLAHQIHTICGVGLCGAFLAFVAGNLLTGNWRQFLPRPFGLLSRMALQARFYLWGIFRGAEHPFPTTQAANFNPLQQIIYAAVMIVACPILLISGILLLFPEMLSGRIFGFDATLVVASIHYLSASGIVLFTFSHIYLATTGTTVLAHLKSMITGWHQG